MTFTGVELLFVKLMKGANEEDWKFWPILNVMTTQEFTTTIKGLSAMQNRDLGRGVTFRHASTERTSCVVALPCADPLSVAGYTVSRVLCFQFCRRTVPEVRV